MDFNWKIGAVDMVFGWLLDWLDDVVGITCAR